MAIGDRKFKWAAHTAWGYPFNFLHNVIEHTFAYTHHSKIISAGSTTAVLAATATVVAGTTVTNGITNPDVPRVLTITFGGTANDFAASTITINGFNVEGKSISDVITVADNQTGTLTGTLVFKRVTSVVLSKADGTGGTFAIGTSNRIGLNHRIPPNFGTIVAVQDSVLEEYANKPTVQAAPSGSNSDGEFVEKNWVLPATVPDGTTFLYFFYWFHKVKVYPPKDSPEFYSTTTSTSTSSTSTSTSTSSTSTSTSSTSVSTSSTSTSTSSTSTSTTTLPV